MEQVVVGVELEYAALWKQRGRGGDRDFRRRRSGGQLRVWWAVYGVRPDNNSGELG
jgi:hypothetical protein